MPISDTDAQREHCSWSALYRVAGVGAIIMATIIPIQSFIFIAYPPPSTVVDFYAVFQKNWFLGLLDRDLLLIIDNIIMILLYLAVFVALRRANPSLMTIGLAASLVGIAAYFPSNTSFEMWMLSRQYAAAITEAERASLLAAGQAMLAVYAGSSFNVYYMINAVALLLFSVVMLQSQIFSKANAWLGIAAGLLMVIPSTAGTVGVYFSLVSLVPWFAWLILFSRQMFRMARDS